MKGQPMFTLSPEDLLATVDCDFTYPRVVMSRDAGKGLFDVLTIYAPMEHRGDIVLYREQVPPQVGLSGEARAVIETFNHDPAMGWYKLISQTAAASFVDIELQYQAFKLRKRELKAEYSKLTSVVSRAHRAAFPLSPYWARLSEASSSTAVAVV